MAKIITFDTKKETFNLWECPICGHNDFYISEATGRRCEVCKRCGEVFFCEEE